MSYNRSYHRFFEGYVEKKVLDPATGKTHIERTYAGDYYRHKQDDKEWKRLKIKYVLLYAWALICLVLQGISKSTNRWYSVFPSLAGIIAIIWLGFYVCAYVSNQRDLTIRQYRDREMLKMTAMAGVLSFGLAFIGQAAWMVIFRYFYLYGFICMVTDVTAVIALYNMFQTERDMDYVKRENKKTIDSDSYDIRYREEE